MLFTKTSISGVFLSGAGFASASWGWISSVNPAVVTGLIAAATGGIIAAAGTWRRQQIEISKIEAQADAEKISLYRKDCEERVKSLEIRHDNQQAIITSLQVEIARWETRYPPTSPTSKPEKEK